MATAQEVETTPETQTSLAALKERYPHIREAVVTALHLLVQDPSISVDDAKAKARTLGVRITAASVASARRLLERMDTAAPAPVAAAAPTPAVRPARRQRAAEPNQDAEELIRAVVGKVRAQGDAQSEKLRGVIRRAVELLQAALA
jgi:hypothetical protein